MKYTEGELQEMKRKAGWQKQPKYLFRSPRPEENYLIFRLESGELVEVGFFQNRLYSRKFLDFEFLGKGMFVKFI